MASSRCPVDDGVLTLLRRHSTEGTICSNVDCAMNDPLGLTVVGRPDEFGFAQKVECSKCGQRMETTCYEKAARYKMRMYSANELKLGDHIAWHTGTGHWHNAIFIGTDGVDGTNPRKSSIRVIEYVFRGCCLKSSVTESVRRLNFSVDDVYRVNYRDAYTEQYTVERARRLTEPGADIHPVTGGSCEDVARWCKTGLRSSKIKRIVQRLSGESKQMHVVQKSSTFVSMALTDGIIPGDQTGMQAVKAVIFAVIPTVAFFFSIVLSQMRDECDSIQPRREDEVLPRNGSTEAVDAETGGDGGRRRRGCCCCSGDSNCAKRCRTYGGPLVRVFVRELLAICGPVAAFVCVGVFVGEALRGFEWAIAVIELLAAILAMPPSFGIGVLIGSGVERLCNVLCCGPAAADAAEAGEDEGTEMLTAGERAGSAYGGAQPTELRHGISAVSPV